MTTDIRATITRLKELDPEFLLDQENKPMKRTLAAIAFGLLVWAFVMLPLITSV